MSISFLRDYRMSQTIADLREKSQCHSFLSSTMKRSALARKWRLSAAAAAAAQATALVLAANDSTSSSDR